MHQKHPGRSATTNIVLRQLISSINYRRTATERGVVLAIHPKYFEGNRSGHTATTAVENP